MPTSQQDKDFAEEIAHHVEIKVTNSAMDTALQWIRANLDPDDVFPEKDLQSWAESNGYVKE